MASTFAFKASIRADLNGPALFPERSNRVYVFVHPAGSLFPEGQGSQSTARSEHDIVGVGITARAAFKSELSTATRNAAQWRQWRNRWKHSEIVSSDLGGQCRARHQASCAADSRRRAIARYYITRMKQIDLIALTLKCTNVAAAAILIVGTGESALIGLQQMTRAVSAAIRVSRINRRASRGQSHRLSRPAVVA